MAGDLRLPDAERRRRLLVEMGACAETVPELLRYTENPYRAPLEGLRLELPLPDELHLAAWRGYVEEASGRSAADVLRTRLMQLRFPIRAGISREPAYRAAIRRGVEPADPEPGVRFADPAGLELLIHQTPVGAVPIVVAREREDFESLVCVLAARNEPVPVPASMGACLVKGLINWDRVRAHRERWARDRPEAADEAAWQREFRRLTGRKELYQDKVLLLSSGPYSAVPASAVGMTGSDWLAASARVRLDHECFHYLTLRLFGSIRDNLLDELIADLAGLVGAFGRYRPRLALRFLGLERFPVIRSAGRMNVYRGDPPLTDKALVVIQRLAVEVIGNLARIMKPHRLRRCAELAPRATLLLALLGSGLDELAGSEAEARFAARWRRLRSRLERPGRVLWQARLSATEGGVTRSLSAFHTWAGREVLPRPLRRKLGVMLDEILTNVARYGYPPDAPGEIEVRVREGSQQRLELVFEDEGRPFNPISRPPPELGFAVRERSVGGLGIHLVKELACETRYERRRSRNILVVRLKERVR